jgi:hypothetical protein
VNQKIEPFGATVFEVLWARARYGSAISAPRDRLLDVILPVVVRYTHAQFTGTEQFLEVYARHLTQALIPSGSLGQHPWVWIAKPLSFEEEERVPRLLGGFLSTVRQAEECCERLRETAGIILTHTPHALEGAAHLLLCCLIREASCLRIC